MDYEQAGELKIGQVGIANLRIRTLDVDQLIREMRERVERAPKLFGRAAVIVDFGGLTRLPDADTARALIDGLRGAGVIPVALAYGALLEGAVLIETVFSWPGFGSYLTGSLLLGDMNAVMGCVLLVGAIFVMLNLLSDMLYQFFDPRTKS
mgnify:CR=1 FL=1